MLLLLWLACAPTVPDPLPEMPAAPVVKVEPVSEAVRVVFLGDSLTAGQGLGAEDAYVAVLDRAWRASGMRVEVVNAGVSGDTTAGGVRRLDWILSQRPDVVVVALGANDMLRGLPADQAEANLRLIVSRSQDAGAAVVLLGMRANPALGPDYVASFDAIYPRLAGALSVPLVPFLLDGVAGDAALNLPDGIHPTAEGHRRIAESLRSVLDPVVRSRVP